MTNWLYPKWYAQGIIFEEDKIITFAEMRFNGKWKKVKWMDKDFKEIKTPYLLKKGEIIYALSKKWWPSKPDMEVR
jgi:hypothetical protein